MTSVVESEHPIVDETVKPLAQEECLA